MRTYRHSRQPSRGLGIVLSEILFVIAWGGMIPGLLWLGRWAGV